MLPTNEEFYEVLAASQQFHGNSALTYSSHESLTPGEVIVVPLRKASVLGIVSRKVRRPRFATKAVQRRLGYHLPAASIELLHWLQAYYPAPLGGITQLFVPRSLMRQARATASQTFDSITTDVPLPPLTNEQSKVMARIQDGSSRSFLLHGDTGTGKTRIYLELAKAELWQGKSVMVLVPEISLTPQLAQAFQHTFREQVLMSHSTLTDVERRQIWQQVSTSTRPMVLVGPRSILFAPLDNIGLIIVDEEHDTAYKQEQAPHYHAVRVAGKLAALHQARLILGSATPAVHDYYVAQQKGVPILRMTELAIASEHTDPQISIVDLRDRQQFDRQPHLSTPLLEAIAAGLKAREQSLIFLNRRGTARIVLCQNCGWQALCPRCDLPLTYHGDHHDIRCHVCGFSQPMASSCPVCQSTELLLQSVGTKAIVSELQRVFPKAKIQRFDTDTRKDERFAQMYAEVKRGSVDILVGTQQLVKGLDLPKLSLVGVVMADTTLNFPDYTATERTYQLITQVLGRIGRGHVQGHAIIQTFYPESSLIQAAITKNWDAFYEQEIAERERFIFPPFCYLLKLTCQRASAKSAREAAQKLAHKLTAARLPIQVVGPTPSFHQKVNQKFQWQLVVKAKNRKVLTQTITELPANWSYDIDPTNLL